ncbi:site-specific DNA-methyltransferase [Moraxella nasicaprae]|uniref:site-specific DNA-methyltransferase n=1 Tax=Moraxella nasicaprae TaxID=2904122 RepID=UPI0021D8CC6D|nr:site-specific DNA-methyltransferase [Moraxella nasicaprae]
MDFDTTQNIFIESDNLEALKILQKSYAGKIKMIYIDPPYNTGNDFIYHDDFRQSKKDYDIATGDRDINGQLLKSFKKNSKDNGYYHSNWLSMMLPRLHLARTLLADDGVIFISIDDNEQAQLKLLCDEIFGGENFVASLIWSLGTGTQAGHFVRAHENILVYFKNKSNVANFSGGEGIIEHSALKKISAKNPASEFYFPAGTRWDAPDGAELTGSWGGSEKTTLVSGRMIARNGKLLHPVTLSAGYAQKSQMQSWFQGLETFDTKGQKVLGFYFNQNGILRYEKDRSVINPPTVLSDVGSTKNGTDEIISLFGSKVFNYPKPSDLIKFLGNLILEENDIALDFFSGSGTTAQAIMNLSYEKNINLNFICIQLPQIINPNLSEDKEKEADKNAYNFCIENNLPTNIAEISKERIRRAGAKIKEKNPNKKLDTGFKVFKLSQSNFKAWQIDDDDIAKQLEMYIDPLKDNANELDVVYELLLKMGLKLTADIKFDNGVYWLNCDNKTYAIVLNSLSQDEFNAIIAKKPSKTVVLDKAFLNDSEKSNVILQFKDAGLYFESI